ncbi:MAG: acyl--CoA ligase [Gammaproteobacteria bacterium]|nr:acyl--CoA ligase [Gammaproteobacteria bacterium]
MLTQFDANAPIAELLAFHAHTRPDAEALVFEDQRLSWRDFERAVNQVAHGIIASGIRRRDMVAILAHNSPAYFVTLFGILKAGACAVPLSGMADVGALRLMLEDCGAKLLFASSSLLAQADGARAGNAMLDDAHCIAFDGQHTGWQSYGEWRDAQPARAPQVDFDPSDPFYLIYSSGTTGVPKGILQNHQSRTSYWAARAAYLFSTSTRMIISTPLYSNTTQFALLPTVAWGGTTILLAKSDTKTYLEQAHKERATHTMQVPVQYRRVRECPEFDQYDLSSFIWKFSTSAPLSADLKRWLLDKWPGNMTEIYGMTEGGVGCVLHAHEFPHKLHTVGTPLPGTLFRIVDEHLREVPRGEVGELIGWSPFMMDGYYNKPTETARSRWTDDEGRVWQRSGDLGRMDEDGFVILLDRMKDMIISGGFNIYASDLEAVLAQHPQVRDCGVIGIPSEEWGETPLALVVPNLAASVTPDELKEWANARLGKLQRLSAVEFRDDLPRSTIGKLLKRELREPYWQKAGKHIA